MNWYDSLLNGLVAMPFQVMGIYQTCQSVSKNDKEKERKVVDQTISLVAKSVGIIFAVKTLVSAKNSYSKTSLGGAVAAGTVLIFAHDLFQIGIRVDEKDSRNGYLETAKKQFRTKDQGRKHNAKLICRDTLIVKHLVGPFFDQFKKRRD